MILGKISNVVFAVNRIQTIFAVTNDLFIMLTSNLFAILACVPCVFSSLARASLIEKFSLLQYGLTVILVFLSSKIMLIDLFHISMAISLGIATIILSAPC
ncbi:MAG: hypothetical protein ACFC1C_02905 [Candidatus Malihini olakiniferum]